MRYIISIIFVVMFCGECIARDIYVNPCVSSARNLPYNKGYGQSPTDSPFQSIAYAQASCTSSIDTIYVYPANPGSDSPYYGIAAIDSGIINIVGVSYGGDSPTVMANTPTNMNISKSCSIDGMKFVNYYLKSNQTTNGVVFADIRNSIFSCTRPGPYTGILETYHYGVSGPTTTYYVYNCSLTGSGAALATQSDAADLNTRDTWIISNSTIRTDTLIVQNYHNVGERTVVSCADCIISCTTTVHSYTSGGVGGGSLIINLDNCDTYGKVYFQVKYGSGTYPTITITETNSVIADPQYSFYWKDNGGEYNYIENETLSTASSTGGLLGVFWGWSCAAPIIADTGRRMPFVETFHQLLWGR